MKRQKDTTPKGAVFQMMKHISFAVVLVSLMFFGSQAAQNPTGTQRLNFKIGIPRGKNPVLLLPPRTTSTIEMSAQRMERDDASGVMHLMGEAEIRFQLAPRRDAVIHAEEATYNPNTAEIRMLSVFQMAEETSR